MGQNLTIYLVLLKITITLAQKIAYNETCNNTEECADHRYQCQYDEEKVLRCLCDRFHKWNSETGCFQIFNATEIMMNMTVSVTENIRYLEDHINLIMRTQIAAGFFVFGMVIVATIAVTFFCIYVHIKDHERKKFITMNFSRSVEGSKPTTSSTIV